mgnify:CR=1 FL=1
MLSRGPKDHADMKDGSYLEIQKGPELTNDKGQEATSIPGNITTNRANIFSVSYCFFTN